MLPATTAAPLKSTTASRRPDAAEPLQVARGAAAPRGRYARTPSAQRSTQQLKHGSGRAPYATARAIGANSCTLRGRPRAALRARRAGAGAVPEPAAAALAHRVLCRRRPVAARKHCNKEKETVTRT